MLSQVWKPSLLIRFSMLFHLGAAIGVLIRPDAWVWLLTAVVFNHVVLTLLGLWPRSHGLGPNWSRFPAAARSRGELALTIDDGPDPEVTPQVLDILDHHSAKATFFCVGDKAAAYPELLREIVRRGHAVENHTQRHAHSFAFWGIAGFATELCAAQRTLAEITGVPPRFFRAPAGMRNPLLEPVLARLGLRLVSWSVRGYDTRTSDAAKVLRRIERRLRPGAIVLLHDGNAARTPEGVPVILEVLPKLLARASRAGLRPVTLSKAAV